MTTVEYLETPETVLPRELTFGVLRVAEAPTLVLLSFENGLVAEERTLLIGHKRIGRAVLPGLQLTPAVLLGSW